MNQEMSASGRHLSKRKIGYQLILPTIPYLIAILHMENANTFDRLISSVLVGEGATW